MSISTASTITNRYVLSIGRHAFDDVKIELEVIEHNTQFGGP
jgi:hypothetical protein